MKKRFLTLLAVAALVIGLSGCVISVGTKYYDIYFCNETFYTITGWGAVDIDTDDIYQNRKAGYIYPDYTQGPLEVPENIKVAINFYYYGSNIEYTTYPYYYKTDCDFQFNLYYDGTYDATKRTALGDAAAEGKLFLVDNKGNKIPVTPAEKPVLKN